MTYVTRLGPVGAALREVDRATAEKIMAVLPSAFAGFPDETAHSVSTQPAGW